MPRYEITSPEGKKFEITAPDGATQEQVLAYAQEQFKTAPKEPSHIDNAASFMKSVIEATPAGFVGKYAMKGLEEIEPRLGGGATDLMSSLSGKRSVLNPLAAEIPPEVSGAVGAVAQMAPGMLIGGGIGGKAAPTVARSGENMMLRAMKPSMDDMRSGDAAKAAKTMLDEGVNVTAGGVEKLQSKITGLNDELQSALNSSPATIDKRAVASRLQAVINEAETVTFTPQDRVKAVEGIYNKVLGNAAIPDKIPVALANRIKSGIYKELADLKYQRAKTGAPMGIEDKANMALASGAREEISAAVPSAAPLNEKMGGLIKAMNISEDEVLRASRRDPGGLALLTHGITRLALMLAARDPATKSMLARALYGGAEAGTTGTGAAVGGTVSALRERK